MRKHFLVEKTERLPSGDVQMTLLGGDMVRHSVTIAKSDVSPGLKLYAAVDKAINGLQDNWFKRTCGYFSDSFWRLLYKVSSS